MDGGLFIFADDEDNFEDEDVRSLGLWGREGDGVIFFEVLNGDEVFV